jgi:hypothetical protein
MKKLTVDYYASRLIDEMLFFEQKDADEFDNALEEFCEYGEDEWNEACKQYASEAAIDYAINVSERFHFNLSGPYSDRLIVACENCVDEDCYKLPMNYINSKL